MKKLNFDSLMSLQTPEEWIDKALAVPDSQKRHISLFYRRGAIAAAAVFAAAVMSAALLLNIVSKPPTEIKPSIVIGTSALSENITPSFSDEYTDEPSESVTESGRSSAPAAADDTHGEVTAGSEPDTATSAPLPSQNYSTDATRDVQQTEEPAAPTPTEGSDNVDPDPESDTQAATESFAPTEQAYTEPAVDMPTQATEYPGSVQPTQAQAICSNTAVTDVYVPDGFTLYCKIIDEKGELIGDSDLYSAQHLADTIGRSDFKTTVIYTPERRGVTLADGQYKFIFYDQYGSELSTVYILFKAI